MTNYEKLVRKPSFFRMFTGLLADEDVAVKNLKDEPVDGGDWIKHSLPPGVSDGRTRPADRCRRQSGSEIIANPPQRSEE